MYLLILFFVLSLINVMLQTVKSILTVRSSREVASIATAVAFAFYYVIIKQLTEFDIVTIVIVTIVTNLLGVWISIWLLDKFKKDQLWRITATVPKNFVLSNDILLKNDISFTKIIDLYQENMIYDFYCKTQKETIVVKELLKNSPAKYCYTVVGSL